MGRRLFVSVDCSALADELRSLQDTFAEASGLRLTDPDQAHLTLKFLGDTAPDRVPATVEAIEAAVAESGVGPFEMTVGGLGVFPSPEYISVVWAGVRNPDPLERLQAPLEDRLVALGFDPEDHEFTPHVTLARMDHAGGKDLVQAVVTGRDPTLGTVAVDAVELTESTLTDGPTYTTVERIPL
jgi:2'-5' RNA ligase